MACSSLGEDGREVMRKGEGRSGAAWRRKEA